MFWGRIFRFLNGACRVGGVQLELVVENLSAINDRLFLSSTWDIPRMVLHVDEKTPMGNTVTISLCTLFDRMFPIESQNLYDLGPDPHSSFRIDALPTCKRHVPSGNAKILAALISQMSLPGRASCHCSTCLYQSSALSDLFCWFFPDWILWRV